MNIQELQRIRQEERRTDSLGNLRADFYEEVGECIRELEAERDRVAAEVDDPYGSPEVRRLTDEIESVRDTVEAIFDKRMGKVLRATAFEGTGNAAVDEAALTAEERELFDLVSDRIAATRAEVLTTVDPEDGDGVSDAGRSDPTRESPDTGTRGEGEPEARIGDPTGAAGASTGDPDARDPATTAVTDGQPAEPARSDGGSHAVSADTLMGDAGSVDGEPAARSGHEGSGNGDADRGPDGGATGQGGDRPGDGVGSNATGAGTDSPVTNADTGDAIGSARRTDTAPDGGEPESVTGATGGTAVDAATTGGPSTDGGTHDRRRADDGQPAGLDGRAVVRITDDVGQIMGIDERSYDLERDDVIALPEDNVEALVDRGAAARLD
ncbi:hypothetical protein BRD17_02130 [Halobacteriales archaeon SW_7_68_16]|nr:MAG: hypothetical protein BRD17_02130 [Halobacteriales archaeon SW_7_68_16]